VTYWYPVRQVVSFKRDVYRKVMKEFASAALAFSYEKRHDKRPNQRQNRKERST
jgi:putative (di)nucleoside polyphosphate hydrolase